MATPDPGPVPKEASAFFRAKELAPAFDHRDVWRDEHATRFTVAKLTQADVLATVQASLQAALDRGETYQSWTKALRPQLESAGWWGKRDVVDPKTGEIRETDLSQPHRLKRIYETNLRQARQAGQWERIQRTKRALPYLMYLLGPSIEHRAEHAAWHNTVLPVDDSWWATHMPMNGWGCKCHVRQVGKAEFERLQRDGAPAGEGVDELDPDTGKRTGRRIRERVPIRTEAPAVRRRKWVNQRTGEVELVPEGIDPGFDSNQGAAGRLERLARTHGQQLTRLPARIGAATYEQTWAVVQPAVARDYRAWAQRVLEAGQATGEARVIGGLRQSVVDALIQRGLEPKSAAVLIRDRDLLHAGRDAKRGATTAAGQPKGLSTAELLELPDLLVGADATLLDKDGKALLVVFPAERRDAGKIVVKLDYEIRTDSGKQSVSAVRTITLVDLVSIRKDVKSGALELLDGEL